MVRFSHQNSVIPLVHLEVRTAHPVWLRAWVRFPVGERFFFMAFRPALGPTQPPIQRVQGGGSDFPGGKAAGV
jgi:hypothetical protein